MKCDDLEPDALPPLRSIHNSIDLVPSDCPSLIVQGVVSVVDGRVLLGETDMTQAFVSAFNNATRQTPGGEQRQCGYGVASFKFYGS